MEDIVEEFDVVVVGGGVGGTALGIMLAKLEKIKFAVFERDGSFAERRQGYGLTLQVRMTKRTSQKMFFLKKKTHKTKHHDAIRVLGGEELDRVIREEDTVNDAHFIFGSSGALASVFGRFLDPVTSRRSVAARASARYNVHLPRQRLRQHLVQLLQQREQEKHEPMLYWGMRLDKMQEMADCVMLEFVARSTARAGDDVVVQRRRVRAGIVVGADGINSPVRAAKMQAEGRQDALRYLGMLVVLGMTPSEHPLCPKTTFQTLDGTTRLFTMPFTAEPRDANSTFWQLSFPCDEQEAIRLRSDLPALRAEIWKRCSHWHSPVPELLRDAADDMITATPVYDRGEAYPFLSEKKGGVATGSRVTLIGDAAHPMSPFKGQGANQALLDAVLLGQVFEKLFANGHRPSEEAICKAIARAEEQMYVRSSKKVEDSRAVAVRLHSRDAVQDPATRGLSEKLLEEFRKRNIGAWNGPELRQLVIQCVAELKANE